MNRANNNMIMNQATKSGPLSVCELEKSSGGSMSVEEATTTRKELIKQRRRRRVRFHGSDNSENDEVDDGKVSCQTIPPLFETLTKEICERLWFQHSEIAAFRAETRKLIIYGKQSPEDETAGLERFNLERSTRKKAAIQFVLLAQLQGQRNADFIQAIASECSEWAVTAGLMQGFQDFCRVYDPLTSLLGAKSAGETTYNDVLFGTSTTSASTASSSCEGTRKRKLRELTSAAPAATPAAFSNGTASNNQFLQSPFGNSSVACDRRVQQRITY